MRRFSYEEQESYQESADWAASQFSHDWLSESSLRVKLILIPWLSVGWRLFCVLPFLIYLPCHWSSPCLVVAQSALWAKRLSVVAHNRMWVDQTNLLARLSAANVRNIWEVRNSIWNVQAHFIDEEAFHTCPWLFFLKIYLLREGIWLLMCRYSQIA